MNYSKVKLIFLLILISESLGVNILSGSEYQEFYHKWVVSDSQSEFRKIQAENMLNYMNTSYNKCSDFYSYTCNNFLNFGWQGESNELRADTFTRLEFGKKYLIEKMLTSFNVKNSNRVEQMVKIFFDACMDTETRIKHGMRAFKNFLNSLANWPYFTEDWSPDYFYWLNVSAYAKLYAGDIFFEHTVMLDYEVENRFLTYLGPLDITKLTKISSESYFRKALILLLKGMHFKNSTIEELAIDVYRFERRLANISGDISEDNVENYQKLHVWSLTEYVPQIDWKSYLSIVQGRNVKLWETIVVKDLKYFKRLGELVNSTNPKILAGYILYSVLNFYIHLVDPIGFFASRQTTVCTPLLSKYLSDGLTSLFSKQYMHPDTVKDLQDMFYEIQKTAIETIIDNKWIDRQTKIGIIRKLEEMSVTVGFPDYILSDADLNRKFSTLIIKPGKHIENVISLKSYYVKMEQMRVGYLLNDSDWQQNPMAINLYSEIHRKGKIVIPIAILLPPFYHYYAPSFAKYGFIGSYIGHELIHSFDIDGLQYGPDGTDENWISETLVEPAVQRFACFIRQYDQYGFKKPQVSVDGENTLSENLADNDGLKLTFLAYKNWLKKFPHLQSEEMTFYTNLGVTNIQAFFIAFAQSHCSKSKASYIEEQIRTDVHAPQRYRVIGSLSNFPEFSMAFGCPIKSLMNPVQKCDYLIS